MQLPYIVKEILESKDIKNITKVDLKDAAEDVIIG